MPAKTMPALKTARGSKAPPAKTSRARKSQPEAPPRAGSATLVVNQYDAAGNGRRMRGMNSPSTGPNSALKGLATIRNRSQDSQRNDWAGRAAPQRWVTTLIGVGITPRFSAIKSDSDREIVTQAFEDWSKKCDADCVYDFFGLQSLAVMGWFVAGEMFPRLRYRRPGRIKGLNVNMQVQLCESAMVADLTTDNWPGLPAGNKIVSGIEFDNIGQRVARWVYREHPGDNRSGSIGNDLLVRVLSSEMFHLFEPPRPNQARGVPDQAPVMTHLRTILDYNDAVNERQRLANLFVGGIEKTNAGIGGVERDPITGQALSSTPLDIALEPGALLDLLPGEKLVFSNPPESGTTFSDYMRTQHTYTAAGSNLPYELLTGDIREVSDRTLRVIITEFRRFAKARQWQVVIPQMLQPILEAWVDQAVLDGVIPLRLAADAKRVEWQPHGWDYIHPMQDVQAKALEVEKGFRSRSSVIAESGNDPRKVDAERKADKEREDDLGLTPPPADPANPTGSDPTKKPATKAEITEIFSAISMNMQRSNDPLVTAISAMASRETAAPVVNAHIHVPPTNVAVEAPAVTIENKVEPTPVTIENKVEGAVVNVDPTPVNVTNTVPTPIVNVTNEVSVDLPDRETTSVIERDSSGNIVNVTQTERTVQ